ncbi:MAG: penicillin-binding protein 1C [Flavobacteriales bacterium]
MERRTIWRRKGRTLLGLTVCALLALALIPVEPLFRPPTSTVLLDRNGRLLAARVSDDGQWRMPTTAAVPERFAHCLLTFEDRHFQHHRGVHLPSLLRALHQNWRAGRIVSGGSTITMQVARMATGNRPRTWGRKMWELLLALRIEWQLDKEDILRHYADNAPFGGNVVGLEAAAWRWFGRPPEALGWAECATLAVLPNAPARIHPGRAREALKRKRDRLLSELLRQGILDRTAWSLAVEEPLPDAPLPLPRLAPHLLVHAERTGLGGRRLQSTLDADLQERAIGMLERHAPAHRANGVMNAAVLVMHIASGEVLAYVGNQPNAGVAEGEVDIVQASRSTGSLLKPFIHAAMIDQGAWMPDQLVADVPTQYEGFAPRNFDDGYDGAVPASEALARSLNVPAVRALRRLGVPAALHTLRGMGLHRIDRSAEQYGLALVMGGAESSLWELTGAYASLVRIVQQFGQGAAATGSSVHPPVLWADASTQAPTNTVAPLSAGAVHHTLQALTRTRRPEASSGWQHFNDQHAIAWKTGTSFGHRDAWAIGVDGVHAVGVWVGNADGEGRPGLTGTWAAAPILFELFGTLSGQPGWPVPHEDMVKMAVCPRSGHKASVDCPVADTVPIARGAERTLPCPYHRMVRVNMDDGMRAGPDDTGRTVPWFVLPAAMEHYYAPLHPEYKRLPPLADDPGDDEGPALIYPEHGSTLYLPMGLNGRPSSLVALATHRQPGSRLHWSLDGLPLGTTAGQHQHALDLPNGQHLLTVTDPQGRQASVRFSTIQGAAQHNLTVPGNR